MNRPAVIVTRAQPGAQETVQRLETLGYQPLLSPALELIADQTVILPDLEKVSGLIFTSANGVRFFIERTQELHLTAWCVGPATAKAARDAGFAKVQESSGNAVDLADHILAHSNRSARPLLHIANAAAKGTLKTRLEAEGQSVVFCPIYKAQRASRLSAKVERLLAHRGKALLLVHSEKGAAAFLELAPDGSLSNLTGVTISPTVSEVLIRAGLHRVHTAKAPNEAELLKALQAAFEAD